MKVKKFWVCSGIVTALALNLNGNMSLKGYAEETENKISGRLYEFEHDSDHYEFSAVDSETTDTADADTYGSFFIKGNFAESYKLEDGTPAYAVENGNIDIYYTYDDSRYASDETGWRIADDTSKTVDDFKLKSQIHKGAVVVQTSKDRETWVTVKATTNIFKEVPVQKDAFYTTTDPQQLNGCYYRMLVLYEMIYEDTFAWTPIPNNDCKKYAEIYEFYAVNKANAQSEEKDKKLKYSMGETVRVKDYDGYYGAKEMSSSDPHQGWTLGNFFVSGYTEKTEEDEKPVFLKNVGDKVTLWFNLEQNLNSLNGKKNLSISEDQKGYDQYFQTPKTDFGHGALIIRYTDYENVTHEPQVYTNFLEANATVGADTIVQLFEEGDYEIALDYEIENDNKVILGNSIFPEYSHYRIFFCFSIRNGNCMSYPFDVSTGAELSNKSITADGFYLDLANSRYLKINITREILKDGMDGLTEDVRFNRPAKDGDQYTEEGVYTIRTSNIYTKQETEKKIYVGKNNILKAYMTTGLSISEIEEKINQGATIDKDGNIVEPEFPFPQLQLP